MDTNDYRKKIEASIAKAQAGSARKSARGPAAAPRHIVMDKKQPAQRRADALVTATSAEEPDDVPELSLNRLADPKESPAVRLKAIKLLQQKRFFTNTAAEWRPRFIEALRTAVETKAVRSAALEVLTLLKDRPTQERLLEGLRQPKRALVPASEALRLLSADIHADVIAVARKLIATPRIKNDKDASVQATRILAADPASVGTLEKVLGSSGYALEARRAAATALSQLSADTLEAAVKAPAPAATKALASVGKTVASKAAKLPPALAKHVATLRRVRE